MGQITGPDSCTTSPQSQIHSDLNFTSLQVLIHDRLGIAGNTLSPVSDQHATHRDTQKLLVNLCLGLSNCHDDAAPVSIFPGNGRLNQRRLGNGEANFAGSSIRGGALNIDGDELARAFPIFHDLRCQVNINLQ